MKSFKQKVLYAAMSSVGYVNTRSDASAVYENNTNWISVIDIPEGKNSQEVLDFNLFLSPKDVWTGVIFGADTSNTKISPDGSMQIFGTDGLTYSILSPFYERLYRVN